jgi:hypothetical protein
MAQPETPFSRPRTIAPAAKALAFRNPRPEKNLASERKAAKGDLPSKCKIRNVQGVDMSVLSLRVDSTYGISPSQ